MNGVTQTGQTGPDLRAEVVISWLAQLAPDQGSRGPGFISSCLETFFLENELF